MQSFSTKRQMTIAIATWKMRCFRLKWNLAHLSRIADRAPTGTADTACVSKRSLCHNKDQNVSSEAAWDPAPHNRALANGPPTPRLDNLLATNRLGIPMVADWPKPRNLQRHCEQNPKFECQRDFPMVLTKILKHHFSDLTVSRKVSSVSAETNRYADVTPRRHHNRHWVN